MTGRDGLGQRVHALEPFSMMGHRLADAPQVVERQRGILVTAVGGDHAPFGRGEVAVRQRSTFPQRGAHLDDRGADGLGDLCHPRIVAVAAHQHPPVRELFHRPDREPAAPVEELPFAVRQVVEEVGPVTGDTGVQHQVVTAGDDHQRVELHVLGRDHRGARPALALPPPPGPQALAAEDEPAGGCARDLDGFGHRPQRRVGARVDRRRFGYKTPVRERASGRAEPHLRSGEQRGNDPKDTLGRNTRGRVVPQQEGEVAARRTIATRRRVFLARGARGPGRRRGAQRRREQARSPSEREGGAAPRSASSKPSAGSARHAGTRRPRRLSRTSSRWYAAARRMRSTLPPKPVRAAAGPAAAPGKRPSGRCGAAKTTAGVGAGRGRAARRTARGPSR